MQDEIYIHKKLIEKGMTALPLVIDVGNFGDFTYIMTEFAEHSIEDYMKLEDRAGNMTFSQICEQMIDAV